jgi:hypothetical protein
MRSTARERRAITPHAVALAVCSLGSRAAAQEMAPAQPPSLGEVQGVSSPARADGAANAEAAARRGDREDPERGRYELRGVFGLTAITGGLPAADYWGYSELAGSGVPVTLGLTGSLRVRNFTYLRPGLRALVASTPGAEARPALVQGVLAPSLDLRFGLRDALGRTAGELFVRGCAGPVLAYTELRGARYLGAGVHGGISAGIAVFFGSLVISFEAGFQWNLFDAGGPQLFPRHGVDILHFGMGYRS